MLGLATIGQSPREDVVRSMFGCPDEQMIVQAGALDFLDGLSIAELTPRQGEHPLVTRLRDNSEVVISKEGVTPLLNEAIQRLEEAGASTVCVLCTGEFRNLKASRPVVHPDAVLRGVVDAVLAEGTLGVLIPHAGQTAGMTSKWTRANRGAELAMVSPYAAAGGFEAAGERLESAGANMIVLDCMGYTADMHARIRSAVDVPVLLANGVVGAVLGMMIPGLIPAR